MITNTVEFHTWIECDRYDVKCMRTLHASVRVVPIVLDAANFTKQMHSYFKNNFDKIIEDNGWHKTCTGKVWCPRCYMFFMRDNEHVLLQARLTREAL